MPVYYLSRVAYQSFGALADPSSGKAWKQLKEATYQATLLPAAGDYATWQAAMRDALYAYVFDHHDSVRLAMRPQLALTHFKEAFAERHPLHHYYFTSEEHTESISGATDSRVLAMADRQQLIAVAERLVGTPYRYAGTAPEQGFDCSGFTQYVYATAGVKLPHNAHLQSMLTSKRITIAEAQPGDLIFFGSSHAGGHRTQHAGIFHSRVGGEVKVIHCVSRGVSIDGNNSSWEHYWRERVLFVQRLEDVISATSRVD